MPKFKQFNLTSKKAQVIRLRVTKRKSIEAKLLSRDAKLRASTLEPDA